MPSLAQKVERNNVKIEKNYHNSKKPADKKCNCPKTKICPMKNKCLEKNVVYQAHVTEIESNNGFDRKIDENFYI